MLVWITPEEAEAIVGEGHYPPEVAERVERAREAGEAAYSYDGAAYVRPVSRGVELADGTYIEDAVRDGYYRARIEFVPLDGDERDEAQRQIHKRRR